MRKIFLIAYHFPPVGGGAVQRVLKFVRFLPDFGYEPVVVTGPGAAPGRWTPEDGTLLAGIRSSADVHRVPGPEPPQSNRVRRRVERLVDVRSPFARWWNNGVAAVAAHHAEGCEIVFAELVPYVTAESAVEVARRYGKPLVVDLQDPWALDEVWLYPSAIHRRRDLAQMRRTLNAADAVIMNTEEARKRVLDAFPELDESRVFAIPNGYDRDDFTAVAPTRDDGTFRIVHTGYLYTEIGLATRKTARLRRAAGGMPVPGVDLLTRSHVFLLEAIDRLIAEDPQLAHVIELHLAGVLSDADREVAAKSRVVRLHGYLPHDEAGALMRSADLLFLPMQDLPHGVRAGLVPGKTYEYLAAARPILAALPEGDARDLLEESGGAILCGPADVDAMVDALAAELTRWRERRPPIRPRADVVVRHEYRNLTEKVAAVLDAVGATPRGLAPGDRHLRSGRDVRVHALQDAASRASTGGNQ